MRSKKLRAGALCLLLCLLLAFSACQGPLPQTLDPQPAPQPPSADARPPASYEPVLQPEHTDFLWEVLGGQGRVYLMGTMHIVRDDYVLTPAILDILDEMDALALEINMLDFQYLMSLGDLFVYPEGSTILDHLSERGQAHLLNMIEVYGLDKQSVIISRPFGLSPLFLDALLEDMPFNPMVGVDMLLNLHAWERDMPIYALEDSREMLTNINNLPDDTLERIDVLTIPPPEQLRQDFLDLYELFLSGDYERVLAFLFPEEEEDEEPFLGGDGLPIEFTEADARYSYYMLEHRDRIMADSVISYLESGENVFVAAGLAHFVGEGSIIALLEEAGYTVVRVDLSQGQGVAI